MAFRQLVLGPGEHQYNRSGLWYGADANAISTERIRQRKYEYERRFDPRAQHGPGGLGGDLES